MSHSAITAKAAEFTENYLGEFDAEHADELRVAREHAADLGIECVSHQVASLLELLAASIQAQAIIEIGTGTGISGAALLEGMKTGGVLTSIDLEAEYQRHAKELFTSLGCESNRTRLIAGRALDVLPRFSDRAYDLIFVDADAGDYPAILNQTKRLLRIGGLVICHGAFATGMADASARDYEATAMRDIATELRSDNAWLPSLLTVGSGLFLASLRTPE
ncbi:MAG: O-methyltransferase [Candidatus Nanopelagicales bacterium]|jgi:predicted O-methyltransferase YrrM|nr:O-methyltransferase [Candidatus Nanopelagicales bacterium]